MPAEARKARYAIERMIWMGTEDGVWLFGWVVGVTEDVLQ